MTGLRRVVASGVGLATAALAVAACGGGGSSSQPPGGAPVQEGSGVVPSAQFFAGKRRDVPQHESGHPAKATSAPAAVDDEVSNTGTHPVNPCTLVSRTEAHTITDRPVGEPVEAPQGPTCVYDVHGALGTVTLAVQSTLSSGPRPEERLHDRMSVKVDGRAGWCGSLGSPSLIVPLQGDRFLSVAAPCPIAAAFAARALHQLG